MTTNNRGNMISAIIPTYRNPAYLDLCLRSATENAVQDSTEIIVVVDGFVEESQAILDKYGKSDKIAVLSYEKNQGMQAALNLGVANATNPYILIENDDNVFPPRWDERMCAVVHPNRVVTYNQVEPAPSIFNFVNRPELGRNAVEFRYNQWMKLEPTLAREEFTGDGRLFPFAISKRWYMAVGGFDTYYQSPFWCDVDFWLKLELTEQIEFVRYHGVHLFHFGSIATKNRGDTDADIFKKSEGFAAQQFYYKWGFIPDIVANVGRNNTKVPISGDLRGIHVNGNGMSLTANQPLTTRVG